MKVFFGITKEELDAAKTKIIEIGKKPKRSNIRRKKQKRNSRRIINRFRFRLALYVALIFSIFFFGHSYYKNTQNSPKANLNQLIADIETTAQLLEEKYTPAIKKIENPAIQHWLLDHFRIIRDNKSNNIKNYFDFKKSNKTEATGFVYNFLDSGDPRDGASFQSSTHTVCLPENFNKNNLFEWGQLAHELCHVKFDNIYRAALPEEYYLSFIFLEKNVKGRGILGDELQAYSAQVELANIFLEGDLERAVINGDQLNPDMTMRRLNADSRQVEDLFFLAKRYYPRPKDGWRKPFVAAITHILTGRGYKIYYFDENNKKFYEIEVDKEGIVNIVKAF